MNQRIKHQNKIRKNNLTIYRHPNYFARIDPNYQSKLNINTKTKPAAKPPHLVPYHFCVQASKVIQDMINQDVIDKHPMNQPAPWLLNIVTMPKADGSIRVTLDGCNINKVILPTNQLILTSGYQI